VDEKTRKSITKELDVCHDCAEYGGHFCDNCLDEIVKLRENTNGKANNKTREDS
jgi:hypothetical protein